MARILWHGISPYRRTGYGVQARLFAPMFRDLGHTVAIAQMVDGHPADTSHEFDGIPIIGPGPATYALPRPMDIRGALGGEPDLVLVLKDAWVLPPAQYRPYNTAVWCNIDCDPMGEQDAAFIRMSGARPIATSRHGYAMMRQAGFKNAAMIPHGVDTEFWCPGDKAEARRLLGLPCCDFLVGINAMNLGIVSRKAFYEQFAAFAAFHAKLLPGSLLLAHTNRKHPEGMDLGRIAARLGIRKYSDDRTSHDDAVRFAGHMNMTELQLRSWYRSLDVLLNATCGEGFGTPIVEALACGVPVIATDCTAMTEKVPTGAGWLVHGQELWNEVHGARWTIPNIRETTAKLAHAAARRASPQICRTTALAYGADTITRDQWKPLLEELTT